VLCLICEGFKCFCYLVGYEEANSVRTNVFVEDRNEHRPSSGILAVWHGPRDEKTNSNNNNKMENDDPKTNVLFRATECPPRHVCESASNVQNDI